MKYILLHQQPYQYMLFTNISDVTLHMVHISIGTMPKYNITSMFTANLLTSAGVKLQ